MKSYVLCGLMLSAGMLALPGCSDDFNPGDKTKGKIAPRVELNREVKDALPTPSRTSAKSISVSDLKLRLIPQSGAQSPQEWNSVDEFNVNEEFVVGGYKLEAYYGNIEDEGFDMPYYYGSSSLVVKENEVTTVNLPVAIANTMVTVNATEAFQGYFASAEFALQSAGSTSEVTYPADATDAAYMKPGEITLYADVTKPNGKSARLEAARFNANPKCHYTVTVDVNGGQVGEAVMVITFSDDLDGTETVEIELNDELFSTSAPSIELSGYDSANTYKYISGALPDGLAPELLIKAPGGLSSIRMTSKSAWLAAQGVADDIDFLTIPDATYTKLQGLGIKGQYHNVDKYARIQLAELLRNIQFMQNDESNVTELAFVAVDKNRKTSAPVFISVEVQKLEAALMSVGGLGYGSTEMDLEVSYNGSDFEKDVKIQNLNERGTWSNSAYTVAPASRAAGSYTLHLSGLPAEGDNVQLRLLLADGDEASVVETRTVARTDLKILAPENDVFARYAIVSVSSSSVQIPSSLTFTVNGDPVAAEKLSGANEYKLTGLTPGSKQKIATVIDGITIATTITTEDATPIPNGDMEEWTPLKSFDNSKLWLPALSEESAVWETNNRLTTSQEDPRAYCCTSGTKQSTDHVSGSYSALIRTVGWGSGNSAASGLSKVKHVTAGELYLGSWGGIDIPNNYGIQFASRPSSVSFQAKYSPKNSADRGYAEITVLDNAGAAIASNNVAIEPSTAFAEITLPLTYAKSSAKAAKLVVKFISTNAGTQYLNKNDLNLGSVSRSAEHVGSQLWIDDVKLAY